MKLYFFTIYAMFSNVRSFNEPIHEEGNVLFGILVPHLPARNKYLLDCVESKTQEIIYDVLEEFYKKSNIIKPYNNKKYEIRMNKEVYVYNFDGKLEHKVGFIDVTKSFLDTICKGKTSEDEIYNISARKYEIYLFIYNLMHQQIVNYALKDFGEYFYEIDFNEMAKLMQDENFNEMFLKELVLITKKYDNMHKCDDSSYILNETCLHDNKAIRFLNKYALNIIIMYTYKIKTTIKLDNPAQNVLYILHGVNTENRDPDIAYISKNVLSRKKKSDKGVDETILDDLKDRRLHNFTTQHAIEYVKNACKNKAKIMKAYIKSNYIISFNWNREFLRLMMYAYSFIEQGLYGPDFYKEEYSNITMTIFKAIKIRMKLDTKYYISKEEIEYAQSANLSIYLLINDKRNCVKAFIDTFEMNEEHIVFFQQHEKLLNFLVDGYKKIMINNIINTFLLYDEERKVFKFLSFSDENFKIKKSEEKKHYITTKQKKIFNNALKLYIDVIGNDIKLKKHPMKQEYYQESTKKFSGQMLILFNEFNDESKKEQNVEASNFELLGIDNENHSSKLRKTINKKDRKEESEKRQRGDSTSVTYPGEKIQKIIEKTKGRIRKQKEFESKKHPPDSIPTKEIVDKNNYNHDPIPTNKTSLDNFFELNKSHKVDNKMVGDKTIIDPHSNNEYTHGKQLKDYKIDEDTDLHGISAENCKNNEKILLHENQPRKKKNGLFKVRSFGGILTSDCNNDNKASSKKSKNKINRSKTEDTRLDRKDIITPIKEMKLLCLEQIKDSEDKTTVTSDSSIPNSKTNNVLNLEDNEKNIIQKLEQRYEESKNFELVATNEEINQLTPQSTLCDAHL
ncbi:hypothetical protein COBT_002916, partial [Conglomerata obtusa]